MTYYVVKILVTAALVVLISEVSKRSTLIGAVLASVPVTSVLAMIWLYWDTRDPVQVAELSRNVLRLVIPSLALFVALPVLLGRGHGFYVSMAAAIAVTIGCYYAAIAVLGHFGVRP
jgi:hypothetical protein